MRFCKLALLSVLAAVIASCATMSEKVNTLQLGMSTTQVKGILGTNYVVKAAKTNSQGQKVELWEYKEDKNSDPYWIFFRDDKLVQWGTPESIKALPEFDDVKSSVAPAAGTPL
jgi:hypothetical protein